MLGTVRDLPHGAACAGSPAHLVVREIRRVEANVFEQVVVNAIVHHTETGTDDKLLCAQHIPGKAHTRPEVVGVFVPDLMITDLEVTVRDTRIEWAASREELVRRGAYRGAGQKCRDRRHRWIGTLLLKWRYVAAKVEIRVNPRLKIMRRSKVLPAQPQVNCEPTGNTPIILGKTRKLVRAVPAIEIWSLSSRRNH